MRGNEVHGSTAAWKAWQAIRAIAGTTVFQFVVTLLLALALLLVSPFANG